MTSSFLRLGVMTAVFDTQRHILLSRRADLDLWTLPGGRLDAREPLEHAAAREAFEETGIEVEIGAPRGLYMIEGWGRMNVVFEARAVGGRLHERTDETRENQFFAAQDTFGITSGHSAITLRDALAPSPPTFRQLTSTRRERLALRWTLGKRYVWNWLRGKPESRFPRFEVSAIALVWDENFRRLLTLKHGSGRALPRVMCDGSAAPWTQLGAAVEQTTGVQPELKWVGVWQDAPRSRLEFVFAASIKGKPLFRGGEWTTARSAPLPARDTQYAARVHPDSANAPIWMMHAEVGVQAGDVIAR
jgi:ADP-ribose pyrophosphatase YjhB (NUDIX family)